MRICGESLIQSQRVLHGLAFLDSAVTMQMVKMSMNALVSGLRREFAVLFENINARVHTHTHTLKTDYIAKAQSAGELSLSVIVFTKMGLYGVRGGLGRLREESR